MTYSKDQNLQKELIELRELEQAAQVRFNQAKNELIRIRKQILEIKKLSNPPIN